MIAIPLIMTELQTRLEISTIQISHSFIQLYCFRQACLYNAHPEPMKGSTAM